MQITFREIISHYKRQAHAKQEVFRTVALQQTDPGLVTQSTGDIIAFYNAVCLLACYNCHYLLQYGCRGRTCVAAV
jgi:retinoblastoma-like protein 1